MFAVAIKKKKVPLSPKNVLDQVVKLFVSLNLDLSIHVLVISSVTKREYAESGSTECQSRKVILKKSICIT